MNISLTRLPWYGQIAAFVVISGVGAGLFYYYYEVPARAEIASHELTLKALKADVAKGQATERKLPQFRQQVEELEERLASLSEVLPEEKDGAELLRQMQATAVQSNLVIKSFKPAPVVTKQLHSEWPISLELDGTYHNLAQFFDRVGKFARIVNISNLAVKGKEKGDPRATITASCTATTFVILDKPEPKKGKGAAAAKAAGAKKVA
ncbi:MAG TPA: type 4a pilus biogenesis protein PilO [Vicinamibacterales bacterium]|nr:type 4a pilus biogenesis protein PilO [Vicinamibacterales bacterium]